MKYKKWVDEVNRVRGGLETRLDKVRLDKNERLAPFNIEFWNKLMSKITQEHILAYPEVEPLYLKLANFLGVTTENLLITAGSDFAIKVVFELFVNSGDEVIFIDPTFAMVDVYCGLYNVKKIKKKGYLACQTHIKGHGIRSDIPMDELMVLMKYQHNLLIYTMEFYY